MTVLPHITTSGGVPEFAQGFACDLRPHSLFEEMVRPALVELISDAKTPASQPQQEKLIDQGESFRVRRLA